MKTTISRDKNGFVDLIVEGDESPESVVQGYINACKKLQLDPRTGMFIEPETKAKPKVIEKKEA